jgi:DNA replication licensing factor MCM6
MVRSYRDLRQNDAGGRSKSSYRITVRQLESLLRLSEAVARLHLDDDVRPEYVREAARLLQKSIIHVRTEDVVLSSADTLASRVERVRAAGNAGGDELCDAEGAGGEDEREGEEAAVKITFERYRSITNVLAARLRTLEEEAEQRELSRAASGVAATDEQEPESISIAELVAWYVAQGSAAVGGGERSGGSGGGGAADVDEEVRVVRSVIRNLLRVDHVLVYVDERNDDVDDDDRLIAVHPNYIL